MGEKERPHQVSAFKAGQLKNGPRPMKVQWLATKLATTAECKNTAAPFFFFFCANFVRKQNKRALSTRSVQNWKNVGRPQQTQKWASHCWTAPRRRHFPLHNGQDGEVSAGGETEGCRWVENGFWHVTVENNARGRRARQQTLRLKEVARS